MIPFCYGRMDIREKLNFFRRSFRIICIKEPLYDMNKVIVLEFHLSNEKLIDSVNRNIKNISFS